MITEIRQLIKTDQFNEALQIIENEIKMLRTKPENETDENHLQELIALRVTTNTLLGKNDDTVIHSVHKLKYPYSEEIQLSNKGKVVLLDSDIFFVESDAYVNTIYETEKLSFTDRSFSSSLQKRLGDASKLTFQPMDDQKGIVHILHHPNLSAPFSYHIKSITESNKVDLKSLSKGIESVLMHAYEKGLKKLCFAALCMDTDSNHQEKARIIDATVKTLDDFFKEDQKRNSLTIVFPFINTGSFSIYRTGFYKYSLDGRLLDFTKRDLCEIHKKLIEKTRTRNKGYIEQLRNLASYINEDRIILFLGETGVGKSYLAEQSHYLSLRKKNNFEVLNCSTVTPEQLYTLVFGWGQKVFQGSPEGGMSIFEKAEGGTVFFDEIGYTNHFLQKALLTFLDKKTYKKVGDQEEYYADVRIMFGTNQDLEKLVRERKFYEDLYERIHVREFKISPLNERPEDIRSFVIGEIEQLNEKREINITIEEAAIQILCRHSWPGNYRQLKNYIQNRFYDTVYKNSSEINEKDILQNPSRDYKLMESNKYFEAEKILTEIMTEWDPEKFGKFKNEYIDPLISKIFLENLSDRYKKSSAPVFLGMDYRDKRLEKLASSYNELLKKLM